MKNHFIDRLMRISLLSLCVFFSASIKADLLDSLVGAFGDAGQASCHVAADILAVTPVRACSSSDTINNPTDLVCRFTRNDCDVAYTAVTNCLTDPLSCTQQAFVEACELTGDLCEQTYQVMDDVKNCLSNGTECSWVLIDTYGRNGLSNCLSAAQVVPNLPPTATQCQGVYEQYNQSTVCLSQTNIATCLNQQFVNNCVAAAEYFPHSAEQCEQLAALVEETMTTVEQCLNNIAECPRDLMQALNAGSVVLSGRIVDGQDQPLLGVLVTAVPVTDDVLAVTTSTHVALSNEEGLWKITINPAFAFTGEYRVNATGAFHAFSQLNDELKLNYLVTVE